LLTQLESKRLGLLHELVPYATEIAVLINPKQPNASDQVNEVKKAARALGLDVHIVHAASESDLEPAFATCAQLRAGGLLVTSDPFFNIVNKQIIALAARDAIPAIISAYDPTRTSRVDRRRRPRLRYMPAAAHGKVLISQFQLRGR
jgi:putative tryptophan/tyrosine transport system substrate-binding protein